MLIYSPDANNLNDFIAKLRALTELHRVAEENRKLAPQELKLFLVYALHLGFKTSIRNRKLQNFLAEAMYS